MGTNFSNVSNKIRVPITDGDGVRTWFDLRVVVRTNPDANGSYLRESLEFLIQTTIRKWSQAMSAYRRGMTEILMETGLPDYRDALTELEFRNSGEDKGQNDADVLAQGNEPAVTVFNLGMEPSLTMHSNTGTQQGLDMLYSMNNVFYTVNKSIQESLPPEPEVDSSPPPPPQAKPYKATEIPSQTSGGGDKNYRTDAEGRPQYDYNETYADETEVYMDIEEISIGASRKGDKFYAFRPHWAKYPISQMSVYFDNERTVERLWGVLQRIGKDVGTARQGKWRVVGKVLTNKNGKQYVMLLKIIPQSELNETAPDYALEDSEPDYPADEIPF